MTTTAKLPVSAGDQIHFYGSMTFSTSDDFSSGHTSRRGETATLTDQLIEASKDRLGFSWLSLANDVPGQEARWGQRMFGIGPWPESASKWMPGTVESQRERERQRVAAHRIADDHERAVALRNIAAEFGPADSGQRSVVYGSNEPREVL
jgi:hypothetical protein